MKRGGAATELALVLPVLLALLGGVVEWGWFVVQSVAVTGAARDGALAGTLVEADAGPDTVAEARARESLTGSGLDGAGATVAATLGSTSEGTVVQVDCEVAHDPLFPLLPMPATHRSRASFRLVDQ